MLYPLSYGGTPCGHRIVFHVALSTRFWLSSAVLEGNVLSGRAREGHPPIGRAHLNRVDVKRKGPVASAAGLFLSRGPLLLRAVGSPADKLERHDRAAPRETDAVVARERSVVAKLRRSPPIEVAADARPSYDARASTGDTRGADLVGRPFSLGFKAH